jgi:integrase
MGKLTAVQVRTLKEVGRHNDGDGLMFVIGKDGSRKWVLRVQANGKRRDLGLGSVSDIGLADAREAAGAMRKVIREGRDPVAEKRKARLAAANIPTFKEAALKVIAEHKPSWRNEKHGEQWLSTLKQHVFPAFGDVRVDQVDGPMVRDVLAEIWLTIPETARRVRQRIGTVLDWAHAKGYRVAEAPTRTISRGLPKQPKKDNHFAALPWEEVPVFLTALRETQQAGETVRLGFEFLILTATRSGEMRGARWNEIDLETKEWRIPADRMKAAKPHTVPLSQRAIAVLKRMTELRASDEPEALIFAGTNTSRPLSDMTLTMLLRRMKVPATAHGFRSSFRDWAAEATSFPREVAEAALAHAVESKVEAAYRRSDLLEKRRKMMHAWGGFCEGHAGKVLPMSRERAARLRSAG